MKRLCVPSRTSKTPVSPACTMVTAVTPLRAPIPPKSTPFSPWPSSLSERHRPHEFLAGTAFLFGNGQCGRNHRATGMRLGDRLEIVRFVGMRAHRVGERGVDRRRAEAGPDHRGLFDAAEAPNIFQSHL